MVAPDSRPRPTRTDHSPAFDLSGWTRRDEARVRAAQELLERVADAREKLERILAAEGVTEAWIFGSIARGTPHPDSDVDIAVAGCRPDRFYKLAAALERALSIPLDLLDLDRAPLDITEDVRASGIRLVP